MLAQYLLLVITLDMSDILRIFLASNQTFVENIKYYRLLP